jgi:hypothetical protein
MMCIRQFCAPWGRPQKRLPKVRWGGNGEMAKPANIASEQYQ